MSQTTVPTSAEVSSRQLTLIKLDFRQWTGACVLKKEDFRLGPGGTLPPENVVHDLGRKCIFDPEHLKVFTTLKRRAERLLADHGVPFMGAMAIPIDKSQTILAALTSIRDAYRRSIETLIADYDRRLDLWLVQNIDYAPRLRGAVLDKNEVRRRIYARFDVKHIECADEECARLAETLLDEIAKEAQTLYQRVIDGQTSMLAQNLDHVRRWRERLRGLRSLDPTLSARIADIDAVLAGMPSQGRLSPEAFGRAATLVTALADRSRTEALCQALRDEMTAMTRDYALIAPPATEPSQGVGRKRRVVRVEAPDPNRSKDVEPAIAPSLGVITPAISAVAARANIGFW